eukprot:11188479-Lingulodinium_polyedra.AAC.1
MLVAQQVEVDQQILLDVLTTQVRKSNILANQFVVFEMKDKDDPERAREGLRRFLAKYTARCRMLENRERQQR